MSVKPEIISLQADGADPFLRLENGSTELLLIRHGDALPGADEVEDGGYDAQPLSELGRRQGQALAKRMKRNPLAAIYSSPIPRARQTASLIGDVVGLEVTINEDLREVGLQPYPYLLSNHLNAEERAVAVRTYLHDVELAALSIGIWSRIPGCEQSGALRSRITAAVSRIASQNVGKRVAIVSHSGAINAYLADSLGLERDFFFPANNASISVIRVKGKQRLLIQLNDIAHLHEGFDD